MKESEDKEAEDEEEELCPYVRLKRLDKKEKSKHHCARLEFGDFWETSLKLFSAREGVVPFSPQKWVIAHQRRTVYEKLRKFEIFWKIVA